MKVYRLIRILHHLGIKIPSDLWQLKDKHYFSNSNRCWLPIEQMDIFHVIRALAKINKKYERNDNERDDRRYG